MTLRHAIVASLAIAFVAASAQQNDQQPPRDRNKPFTIDPVYQKLADETGGVVFVPDREHPEQLSAAMVAEATARRPLVNMQGDLSGERSFEASLTGSESKLVVTATGVQSLQLKRPDGISVVADGVQTIYARLGNGGMFVVEKPESGTWTATISGQGHFSLRMNVPAGGNARRDSPVVNAAPSAASQPLDDIEFDAFEFQQVAGRPGHEGLFKIDGYPVAGKSYPVEARISGDFSTVRFEFRTIDGQPLQALQLKHDREDDGRDQRVYRGEVTIPDGPFRVYASGLDMHGQRYQRVIPQPVRPQSFTVNGPGFTEWHPGEPATATFTVTNAGDAAEFEATIVDTAKLLKSDQKIRFSLAAGESKTLELAFDVPIAAPTTHETVIVTVRRGNDPNATNHAILDPDILSTH